MQTPSPPPQRIMPRRWRRASVIAILLLVGFWGLVTVILLALLGAAGGALVEWGWRGIPVAVLCGIAFSALVRAYSLPPDRFEPLGPPLTREQEPELFRCIDQVVECTGGEAPHAVYLAADINAYSIELGGGWRRKRVLVLGLPLFSIQTVQALRATLAHELAHFHQGDPTVNGMLYRVRERLRRTILASETGVLAWPFRVYARAVVRVTEAISKEQEFRADVEAARVAGAHAHVDGLRRVAAAQRRFAHFEGEVLAGIVAAGFWPEDLFEGWQRFSQNWQPGDEPELLDEPPSSQGHPALTERIGNLSRLAQDAALLAVDARPAKILLGRHKEYGRAITAAVGARVLPGGGAAHLCWDEYGAEVLAPQIVRNADDAMREVRQWFGPTGTDSFASAGRTLLEMFARSLPAAESAPARPAEEEEMAMWLRAHVVVLASFLIAAALLEDGGHVDTDVGEPLHVTWGGMRLNIGAELGEAAMTPEAARRLLQRLPLHMAH